MQPLIMHVRVHQILRHTHFPPPPPPPLRFPIFVACLFVEVLE